MAIYLKIYSVPSNLTNLQYQPLPETFEYHITLLRHLFAN